MYIKIIHSQYKSLSADSENFLYDIIFLSDTYESRNLRYLDIMLRL